MRITVLLGGVSAERDVSLSSGLRMAEALRASGHDVQCFDPADGMLSLETEAKLLASGVAATPPSIQQLEELRHKSLSTDWINHDSIRKCDCVVMGLHGGQGEDGTVQAALDLVGVPYTGSGHMASALAMDKNLTKIVLRHAGVPTPDWLMAPPLDKGSLSVDEVERKIAWPAVVKPSRQGSTVGLSVVKKSGDLDIAVREAYRFDDAVMVERFVEGREFTVGVLGDKALPVIEIVPVKELYDYECKYTPGMAEEFVADIPDDVSRLMSEYSLAAFQACGLSGCARVDFRMDPEGGLWCLEVNTLPGMTPTSLIPQAAAAAGLLFPDLCCHIVDLAIASNQ